MRHPHALRAAAGVSQEFDFLDPGNIGLPVEGGYFAGLISFTANSVATHALIVAPVATGTNGEVSMQWKTANSTSSGAASTYDGAANTAAIANTTHPAANYCANLTIDGYSDWYLPAYHELGIAYINLKPYTDANNTNFGANPYAVPARGSNYSTFDPAQTSVTIFQLNQAEDFLRANYWSSTHGAATSAWAVDFQNGSLTTQAKTSLQKVRAFRKVAL